MRGPADAKPGALRRVTISNVNAWDADARFSSIIGGIPGHDIEDVSFNNIRIWYRPLDAADKIVQKDVPEFIKDYPEPQRFGLMPAYGFFVRHAGNIRFNNVQIGVQAEEQRPAIIAEDVKGLTINGLNARVDGNSPVLLLRAVSGLSIAPNGSVSQSKIRNEPVRPTVPDVPPAGGSHNQ